MSGNRTDRLCLPPLHLGVRRFPNSLAIRTDLKSSEYADTWKAGYALGQFLEGDVCAERLAGRAVLELGAGCGYAGLVAATLGAQVGLPTYGHGVSFWQPSDRHQYSTTLVG
mmetsp:Transcript_29162/g.82233  ORF Transcript_29162/g.82233 Transcript_29162/m.82233 type:complete len:112 (-) Transcript_29162:604-939(-)